MSNKIDSDIASGKCTLKVVRAVHGMNTTARLASHDLGTHVKWPKMIMQTETARRPAGMVTMHVSCKGIVHMHYAWPMSGACMHAPRQPLEMPNFRYVGRDFSA